MRPHQIESWALNILDRVDSGQPIEDTRVELKSEWIEPGRAARRIAGHANASRGAAILWLIGVDEKKGVIGAPPQNIAEWHSQIKSFFDGIAPEMRDFNIPYKGVTVVALLFSGDRIPYVVTIPSFGKTKGLAASLEVPWRDGTTVKSATRDCLIRLLSPLQSVSTYEILDGQVDFVEAAGGYAWSIRIGVYVEIELGNSLVIPFHRCEASIQIDGTDYYLNTFSINPPEKTVPDYSGSEFTGSSPRFKKERLSLTIKSTEDEVIIDGPGKMLLKGSLSTPRLPTGLLTQISFKAMLSPIHIDLKQPIHVSLKGKVGERVWKYDKNQTE